MTSPIKDNVVEFTFGHSSHLAKTDNQSITTKNGLPNEKSRNKWKNFIYQLLDSFREKRKC